MKILSINYLKQKFQSSIAFQGITISFLTLLLLYPDLFYFHRTVMGSGTWELQDPAVSSLVYVPGVRVLRHEILENHGILWSSMRSTGLPLIGNEVQAAPFFPLTWLCFVFPDPYFWNVFVLLRIFLISVFTYLLARNIYRFSITGSIVFLFCAAFSVHVLRWSNHAWQSGYLAGLVYLYFLYKCIRTETHHASTSSAIGLLLGVYGMITCGFPEASLMMALLVLFLITPELFSNYKSLKDGKKISVLIGVHAIGFGLSSPQLLGLLDFIGKESLDFRAGPGRYQYEGFNVFLRWVTRVSDGPPKGDVIHFFNPIPLFLFTLGCVGVVKKIKQLPSLAIIFTLLFFLVKNFPLWPSFNLWIASIPIAASSWFIVYSLVLLIFPFSYFCAVGVEEFTLLREMKTKGVLFVLLVFTGVSLLVFWSSHFQGVDFSHRGLKLCALLLLFSSLFLWSSKKYLSWIVYVGMLLELASVRPTHFRIIGEKLYHLEMSHTLPKEFTSLLTQKGISKENVREISGGGLFVGEGISTFNNGSPPIVPDRVRRGIETFFYDVNGWGPHLPVTLQKHSYSWQMAGVTHYVGNIETNRAPISDARELVKIGKIGENDVFEDKKALGRAYLAERCIVSKDVDSSKTIFNKDKSITAGTVVLETEDPKRQEFCHRLKSVKHRVLISEDRGSFLKVESVRGPGILVLNDLFFKDWTAKDLNSGRTLEIIPANLMFRGIVLEEEKDYQIQYSYSPPWVQKSIWLVLLSAGSLIPLLIWCRAKPRTKTRKAVKPMEINSRVT